MVTGCLFIVCLAVLTTGAFLAVVVEVDVRQLGYAVPGATVTVTFEDGTEVAKKTTAAGETRYVVRTKLRQQRGDN